MAAAQMFPMYESIEHCSNFNSVLKLKQRLSRWRGTPYCKCHQKRQVVLKTPTKGKETKKSYLKEMKKHSNAPMGFRTGYMIFLKMECERLKTLHGEDSAGQYRANEAWRNLSDSGRQVYFCA